MSWLHISAETAAEIETICNEHFKNRGTCDCPLWNACNYSNDLSKTDEENTRIFEQGMAAALASIKEEHTK